MTRPIKNSAGAATRNPERSRERILAAALKEFAAKGFAGARVDFIARRAAINKRMLYHYFGNKEGLFKAVLRRKITECQARSEVLSGDPAESLAVWFEAVCHDTDWVRLLEWEALQEADQRLIDEKNRRAAVARGLERFRQRQARGQISAEFDPRHIMLATRSLTVFPAAFPQLTRLIMGRPVSDPKFQKEHAGFLRRFAAAFRPAQGNRVKIQFLKQPAMKKILVPSILALTAAMLASGCSGGAKKVAGAASVLVARAFTTNVPVQIDPPPLGHAMAYSTVTVRPQVGGILQEVHFKEGQEVKKGGLLFTIDPRPALAALAAARAALARDTAQLENAKIQFDREQKLLGQKLVSQDEFDTSKAGMDALAGTVAADEAAVTNAALNLEFTEIRAPLDGVTGSLQFHEGNVVSAPGDTLVTINQIHPIYVQFGVPEQFLPVIQREMRGRTLRAVATFENMGAPPPEGELTFVDNAVDATTGMIQLRAAFPNADNALWPGQYVHVTLTLSELTNAIVVPSQAVQTGQNGQFIYVVKTNPTNTAVRFVENRPVATGITYRGQTVVEGGLKAGETVVTDGQLRLAPGVKVNVKASGDSTTNSAAN
ncbi:MAG: efflux RND transporter periplasmic adaptor subunit [Verrucomicrobiota bacterium]|jgi:multidrug efflux system membrane fusion protein